VNSLPDLLRLLAVPAFAWVAWRDVATRRVPDRVWLPLLFVAGVALLFEFFSLEGGPTRRFFPLRVGLSAGLVVPLSYAFWRLGGFGGADAKAFIVLSVLFPVYPAYGLLGLTLPSVETALGIFSLTIVTNAVLVGVFYPVALAARNALAGEVSLRGFVARPVPTADVTTEYGRLLDVGPGRGGLDLDALRMYLRWRGHTLEELRADRSIYRDPRSLPEERNPPGDGAIRTTAADGGALAEGNDSGVGRSTESPDADLGRIDTPEATEDPWGAAAFLEDIDSTAYGTSPGDLREALDALTIDERVWITPGIPFLVPLFFGLCLALVYGDLLFGGLRVLGVL
jgi:preflagellin peptidase FlaK